MVGEVQTVMAGMEPVSGVTGEIRTTDFAAVGLTTGVDTGQQLSGVLNELVKRQVERSIGGVAAPTMPSMEPVVFQTQSSPAAPSTGGGNNSRFLLIGTIICVIAAGITIYEWRKKRGQGS